MNSPAGIRTPNEILRARARAIAVAPPDGEMAGAALGVIEFGLAEERYAIEISRVTEIHPLDQMTPVPCTPEFILGIINVRGRMVAVIDVKRFFQLPEKGITDLHRVILIQHQDIELGLLADYVVGTRAISVDTLQPALPTLTGIRSDYLKGIAAGRLIVLDAERILTDPKLIVNDEPTV